VAAERGHDVTLYEKSGSLGANSASRTPPRQSGRCGTSRTIWRAKSTSAASRCFSTQLPPGTHPEASTTRCWRDGRGANIPTSQAPTRSSCDRPSACMETTSLSASGWSWWAVLRRALRPACIWRKRHEVVVLTRKDRLAYDATPIHYVRWSATPGRVGDLQLHHHATTSPSAKAR